MKSRCYCEISKENFLFNLKNLQAFLHGEKIIGIVKTNYYGHDGVALAKIMEENGVDDFAVAALNEGVELRREGIKGSILILGYVEKHDLLLAHENRCIVTLSSLNQLDDIIEVAMTLGYALDVEVKVDTGMNRIGIEPDCDDSLLKKIYDNPLIHVNGTFSHLCTADSFEEIYRENTLKQKETFDYFLNRLEKLKLNSGRRHLCASSGIVNYPQFHYDAVRPGFLTLGFTVGEINEPFERKPVLGWYSKVEMVKTINVGEGISYGHTFVANRPMKIATLSVGYGDGYPRRLSNRGYVVINGHKAPIVGNICMDQMMVDVSDFDVCAEDVVTLIGEGISADELAKMCNTIVDEIVCDINPRVKRILI